MNLGLRNELSVVAGLGSLLFLLGGKKKWAATFGGLALGTRLLPIPEFSFRGKSVVVTGGSRGLGLALAEELLAQGARVALLARDQDELSRAKTQLGRRFSGDVLCITCDVTHRQELKAAFNLVREKWGRLDVLINNAGSVSAGPFAATNLADFQAQMDLHFSAPLKAIQLALPIFREQGGGRVVNISSVGGKIPVPHMAPYCASKFALAGLSQSLSNELRSQNIRITTIYPGLMQTGSAIQAVFKGDHEKEYAWFALSDSTPGLSMPAARAARQILRAVSRNQSEAVLSLPAKIGVFAHDNFPEIFAVVMSMVNRGLPSGTSQERQTGAASRGWLDRQFWSKPFRLVSAKAEQSFNEKPKMDADFNLGVHGT